MTLNEVGLTFIGVGFGFLILGSYIPKFTYELHRIVFGLGVLGGFSLLVGLVIAIIDDIRCRRRKKREEVKKK